MRELQGKVAVVTGAANGIGLALARAFAAEGMRIVLADCDGTALHHAAASMLEDGADVIEVRCDTSDEADVQALADAAVTHYGGAHVLCNNAGVVGRGDPWTGPMSNWEWVVGVNLYGVVHGVRSFLPLMNEQGEGHIVNTASMAGLVALPGAAPYNVTKHGVVALSEGLYVELVGTGSPVRVSVLCPGFVRTNLMDGQQWNDRFGPAPEAAHGPMHATIETLLRQGIASGIPAEQVAHDVVDAVRSERFWILTHPEMRDAPVERMRRAASQENPA